MIKTVGKGLFVAAAMAVNIAIVYAYFFGGDGIKWLFALFL